MKRVILMLGVTLLILLSYQMPASADPIKGVITTTSIPKDIENSSH